MLRYGQLRSTAVISPRPARREELICDGEKLGMSVVKCSEKVERRSDSIAYCFVATLYAAAVLGRWNGMMGADTVKTGCDVRW